MNDTQKEIARAMSKVTEAMNIIGKVAEENGMHIRIGKRKDPCEILAEKVGAVTEYDVDDIYAILAAAADILGEEAEDDN